MLDIWLKWAYASYDVVKRNACSSSLIMSFEKEANAKLTENDRGWIEITLWVFTFSCSGCKTVINV